MESEDTISAEDLESQMSAIINEYGDVTVANSGLQECFCHDAGHNDTRRTAPASVALGH